MPLVFVHGVATRPSTEQAAMVKQRDALFRSLVLKRSDATIINPDWGSFAAQFGENLPWLPSVEGDETFDVNDGDLPAGLGPEALDGRLALGRIAGTDAEQAIDLVAMAALDSAIRQASRQFGTPEAAAAGDAMRLAEASAVLLAAKGIDRAAGPKGVPALTAANNSAFADALETELALAKGTVEAYSIGDTVRSAIDHLVGLVGNGASDLLLKAVRRDLSRAVSLFMGDIFVYLRGRDTPGPDGTRARILEPIQAALAAGAMAKRAEGEPFVVVGHSLGGVILYDLLTDATARAAIETATGAPITIDALFTVGSQPGFFADLGLYPGGRPADRTKLPMPEGVRHWMNVFDFTDVFSFKSSHAFEGVQDFGYDTVTDLVRAHGSYFLRPSFYARMRARLVELGYA